MKKTISFLILLAIFVNVYSQNIFTAIENNDLELVKKKINENPDLLNEKGPNNFTPLNKAAYTGKEEIALELIKLGADITIGDQDNTIAFHYAAFSGLEKLMDYYYSKGYDVNFADDKGNTPLFLATQGNQTEIARSLIEKGANVKAINSDGWPIILMATIKGNLEIAQMLVDKKAKVNIANNNGVTALFSASSFGWTEIAQFLIENGADVNYENEDGETPLFWAVNTNTEEIVKLLVSKGADINKKSNFGRTPFMNAAQRGSVNIVQLQKDLGADIHAVDNEGWNALTLAAYSRNPIGIAKWLVINGVDPNPKPCYNEERCTCGPTFSTPLVMATREGNIELAKILINSGAKVNTYSKDGMTPLHYAVKIRNLELTKLLVKNGAFLNSKELNLGNSELHFAAIQGCKEIAEYLIKQGSDVNRLNDEGKSALDLAFYYDHKGTAYSLLANGADDSKIKDMVNVENPLLANLNDKEAKVWFLGHSGWAIKTKNHFMIFDYYINLRATTPLDSCLANGFIKPEELKDLKVTVFSTHSHGDHYSKAYFDWKEVIPDMEIVLCFNPNDVDDDDTYQYIPIHDEKTIHGIKISTIASTDLDGAFFIEVDGLNIFHAGDHANGEDELMDEFTEEVDLIAAKNKAIDILFGGIRGCSLGTPDQVKLGVKYMVETLNPKVFVPMHNGEFSFNYKNFADEFNAKDYATAFKYVVAKGDRFTYKNGILHN